MLLPRKIRSLLNGGGAAAGPEGIAEAIRSIEAEMAEHRRELTVIPTKRADAALADDGPKVIAALKAREDELYAALEVCEIQINKLRQKLQEQTDLRRRGRIEYHREQTRAVFQKLDAALKAAVAANVEVTQIFDAAARELGGNDAQRLIPILYYGGMVNPEGYEIWRDFVRSMIDRAPAMVPAASSPQANPTPKRSSMVGAVVLDLWNPAPPLNPPPPGIHGHMVRLGDPPANPPAKPLRPLFDDVAGAGEQRVKILRTGYETPDGRQCRNGDVVALPASIAQKVIEHGAGEYAGRRE